MIIAFGDAILFAKLHGRQVAAPTALNDKGAINSILIYATRHAFACLVFFLLLHADNGQAGGGVRQGAEPVKQLGCLRPGQRCLL